MIRPALWTTWLLSCLLTACALGQAAAPITYYGIEPPPPPPSQAARAEALRIGPVRVADAYSAPQLVYRLGEVRFAADFYHRLMAPPGALIGNAMAQWLNSAGPMRRVTGPNSAVPERFVLDLVVTELYGDFRPGQAPAAVMQIQLALLDTQGSAPIARLQRTLGRRVLLTDATPEALARGWGEALGQMLGELQPELANALR